MIICSQHSASVCGDIGSTARMRELPERLAIDAGVHQLPVRLQASCSARRPRALCTILYCTPLQGGCVGAGGHGCEQRIYRCAAHPYARANDEFYMYAPPSLFLKCLPQSSRSLTLTISIHHESYLHGSGAPMMCQLCRLKSTVINISQL